MQCEAMRSMPHDSKSHLKNCAEVAKLDEGSDERMVRSKLAKHTKGYKKLLVCGRLVVFPYQL